MRNAEGVAAYINHPPDGPFPSIAPFAQGVSIAGGVTFTTVGETANSLRPHR